MGLLSEWVLHELADRGARQAQRVGRLGKRTGLGDTDKGAYGEYLIHKKPKGKNSMMNMYSPKGTQAMYHLA